jgi:HAD superfamily hydrolase (TIGR01458 family)
VPDAAALLIDLDGTLYTDAGIVPGAVAAIARLRQAGRPFRFVTNTTRRSRRGLVERLRGYGFEVSPEELYTSVLAGVRLLRQRGIRQVAPFVAQEALEDLAEFELVGGTSAASAASPAPAAVVIGDLGDQWTPALLNEAFRYLLEGALLVAFQRDRYWLGKTGLELDAGPYVAALEYATNVKAIVSGKPSPGFYLGALSELGIAGPSGAAMVGDDLWADVAGAQGAGLQGWLVRTGKFRQDVLEKSGVKPDRVLDSIAGVLDR